ncbi:kinesin-like protein KIF27 isoform X4 [Gracilinanus agilis]|uniref:kinesin-like protein KIF27 isoform X4 n=1 Tax=Gracilinanus agilis TaxID=191870 RepID=UPI001CFF3836|nr:kinesin-like protein KIF27 isoform X4 [Gracilinanus agilis]
MEEIPVRVAVRVRPLLCKEILHNHQVCVRLVPNTQQIIIGKDRIFTFDFVFGKNSTQDEVYTTCIKPLVASLIEGYNATVFAYGQTGSGKTYTIGGGHIASVAEDKKGIIPRAIQDLFQSISENSSIDFNIKVSYIEVYKEDLRDLLELETSIKDLHIREDEKGNTVIVGAKECSVENADEVISLLEMGNAARHTGTTQMNEHSSRSHAVFTISISQQDFPPCQKNMEMVQDISQQSTRQIVSKFHFVDLAGSERATKTGNTGERFKESIQINSGLLALGNVISALGDPRKKGTHIPYRDAKITRILKDSLGGNAKTVMITCISPSSSDFDESLNSLKYANRARNIRNKPIVNYNPDWDRMDEMEFEIKLLREALQSQQASALSQATQLSQDVNRDKNRIHSLEEQVAQLQGECFGYQNCIEEAFTFLADLKDVVNLTQSQQHRLQEWFNMTQEMKKDINNPFKSNQGIGNVQDGPHHITVLQLKRELKKCQCALAADEVVFNQKELELKDLQHQMQTMTQENKDHLVSLKEAQKVNRLQNDKIVEQQLLVNQLNEELMKLNMSIASVSKGTCGDGPDTKISEKRPYTVPLDNSFGHYVYIPTWPDARKVHTSPPMYSLDRVVAGFRTRSQMLLGHIEEQDEVLHCEFSDNSDEEDTENQEKPGYRAPRNLRWIRKPTSICSLLDLSDVPNQKQQSGLQNEGIKVESLQESQVLNMQKLKNSELRLTEAKQKMRELTINIKMKEELIKELIKTGNDAKAVSKQYSLRVTKLAHEAEQAKVELTETQKQLQELENKDLRDVALKLRLQKEFRKKMDAAKLKVQVLQKKQQDTKKLASLSAQNEKHASELEQNVDHMKYQQAQLQKRLREENEKKKQLDAEIKRDQQKIKELQLKTEQQEKFLKMKSEEFDAFRRRKQKIPFGTIDQLQEEHLLFQLEEGIEALEAAIDYKSENIQGRQHSIRASFQILTQREGNVMEKLISLTPAEIRAILYKYFNKVVSLREAERKLQLQNEEIKMKVQEQASMVRELESAVERLKLQSDRQLTLQRKEHEQKMQLLLQYFKDQDGECIVEMSKVYEDKVQLLEKDLYFYKKTSRELKKKLKELVEEASRQQPTGTEYNEAGNGILNQEEASIFPEELKWASRTENIINPIGKVKETESPASSLRTQPNLHKFWEDISEVIQTSGSLAQSGHLLSNEDKTESDENQLTKSHTQLLSQPQTIVNVTQLQGVTPVKLCRRELRQISASELSLRRSNLGVGVGSMVADSIEVSRKSTDLKT